MGAAAGIDALVGEAKPLDWAAGDEMFPDDLFGIFGLDGTIPNSLWIDDNGRAVLALIEAA